MGTIQGTRVVIDTNVLISALLFGGIPGKLIPLWKAGRIKVFASKEITDEYLRVLTYPKFKLTKKEIEYLIYQEILPYFAVVSSSSGPIIVKEDPTDDKFIRCAIASRCKLILSGNHHLLSQKQHAQIKILTPARFLDRLPVRYGLRPNLTDKTG